MHLDLRIFGNLDWNQDKNIKQENHFFIFSVLMN